MWGAYKEIKTQEKVSSPPEPVAQLPNPDVKLPNPKEYRTSHLKYEAEDFVGKFAEAAHRCETLEILLHNTTLQWKCEREGKNSMIAELQAKNKELELKIIELETSLSEFCENNGGDANES